MITLEIILFAFFVFCILIEIRILNKKTISDLKQLYKNFQDSETKNADLLKISKEMQNELNKKNLLIDIMLLQMCSEKNDYEKFTLFFQRLHFDGVPDDILKDGNLLGDFAVSLTNENTEVILNTDANSPFRYIIKTNINKVQ